MSAKQRDFPYIWVTWLAPLMCGADSCYYKLWFKANHSSYEKTKRDFDFAAWNEAHTALLNKLQDEYGERYPMASITREDQNSFIKRGDTAIIAGKIDLLVQTPESPKQVLIIDAKSGAIQDKNTTQVKIYMLLAPRVWPEFKAREIVGIVAYERPEDRIEIPYSEITAEFKQRFKETVAIAVGDRPRATPSHRECGFCDLTRSSCLVKIEGPPKESEKERELF